MMRIVRVLIGGVLSVLAFLVFTFAGETAEAMRLPPASPVSCYWCPVG